MKTQINESNRMRKELRIDPGGHIMNSTKNCMGKMLKLPAKSSMKLISELLKSTLQSRKAKIKDQRESKDYLFWIKGKISYSL